MADITRRLASLKPFGRRAKVDEDDKGSPLSPTSLAGGGHAGLHTPTWDQLRVSRPLRAFLAYEGILAPADAGIDTDATSRALHEFMVRPHAVVLPQLTDRSHPLSHYFISSSHNTYLLTHQLFGASCPSGYESVLKAGARCVEIDAWDNPANLEEPKVTHGYTLVSNIPFRTVCETIRDMVDREAQMGPNAQGYAAAPIFLSLENHCSPASQLRLVEIMNEVWGDRLLSAAVRQKGHDEQMGHGEDVRLAELGSKICVMVEYHLTNETPLEEDEDDNEYEDEEKEGEDEKAARKKYADEKKKAAAGAVIIPELAAIGVYAQSVKPLNNSWFEGTLEHGPHHHLINVSESGLGAHLPAATDKIAAHNSLHLMRVYPKGTRIGSQNLRPVPFWGVGAQVCALNWQTFGAGMQLNEALFTGTDGYVLKPAYLRGAPRPPVQRKRLRLRVAGATDVPGGREDIKAYVTCTLVHPADLADEPPKRKTHSSRHKDKLPFLDAVKGSYKPSPTDPIWDETLEWEYDDDELVFLRILVKSDDRFARNPVLAAGAVRLQYAQQGWNFIRLLDLHGDETKCTVLVQLTIENA